MSCCNIVFHLFIVNDNNNFVLITAISAQNSQDDDHGEMNDVILIVGPEGSDIMSRDEPIPVTQRKDSTDEDLMNVMQVISSN